MIYWFRLCYLFITDTS
ncbi:MAG: hypothetical protein ACK4PR_08525 [Gammaproteobacteria bacterium]